MDRRREVRVRQTAGWRARGRGGGGCAVGDAPVERMFFQAVNQVLVRLWTLPRSRFDRSLLLVMVGRGSATSVSTFRGVVVLCPL